MSLSASISPNLSSNEKEDEKLLDAGQIIQQIKEQFTLHELLPQDINDVMREVDQHIPVYTIIRNFKDKHVARVEAAIPPAYRHYLDYIPVLVEVYSPAQLINVLDAVDRQVGQLSSDEKQFFDKELKKLLIRLQGIRFKEAQPVKTFQRLYAVRDWVIGNEDSKLPFDAAKARDFVKKLLISTKYINATTYTTYYLQRAVDQILVNRGKKPEKEQVIDSVVQHKEEPVLIHRFFIPL